jgi:hypothetical protein
LYTCNTCILVIVENEELNIQRWHHFKTYVEGGFTSPSNTEYFTVCAWFEASWLMMAVPFGVVCENDGIVMVPAPPLLNFLFLCLFRRLPNTLLRELNLRLFRNLRENLLLDDILDIRFDILIFLLFFIFDFDDVPPPIPFDTLTSLCCQLFLSIPLLSAV